MFTYHSELKCLVNKPVLGGNICRWLLLFQEFDFEIIVNPWRLNAKPDHMSRIETGEESSNIEDGIPNVQLFKIGMVDDHYEKIVHFFTTGKASKEFIMRKKKQLVVRAVKFHLITRQL